MKDRSIIYFFELSPFIERVFVGLNLVLEELLGFIEVFQQEQQYADPPVPEGRKDSSKLLQHFPLIPFTSRKNKC